MCCCLECRQWRASCVSFMRVWGGSTAVVPHFLCLPAMQCVLVVRLLCPFASVCASSCASAVVRACVLHGHVASHVCSQWLEISRHVCHVYVCRRVRVRARLGDLGRGVAGPLTGRASHWRCCCPTCLCTRVCSECRHQPSPESRGCCTEAVCWFPGFGQG